MLRSNVGRFGLGIAALAVAAALIVPAAFGHTAAAPKLVGNAKAGKSAFATTCAACHTLKAAGAVGTIGPNLDKTAKTLTEATIIKAITKGGSSVMTKAQIAACQKTGGCATQMVAYGNGTLPAATINNIAAFVYSSTHM
jgi:mono/diheme cytochrome c family protein